MLQSSSLATTSWIEKGRKQSFPRYLIFSFIYIYIYIYTHLSFDIYIILLVMQRNKKLDCKILCWRENVLWIPNSDVFFFSFSFINLFVTDIIVRKRRQVDDFRTWVRLFAFNITIIPSSLPSNRHNYKVDGAFYPGWSNQIRRKFLI